MTSVVVISKIIVENMNMLPSIVFITVTGISYIMLDLLFDCLYGPKK